MPGPEMKDVTDALDMPVAPDAMDAELQKALKDMKSKMPNAADLGGSSIG